MLTDDEKRELIDKANRYVEIHGITLGTELVARLADALEGTPPEPDEWEYLGQAFRESGSIVYQNDGLASETVEQWRKRMAYLPRVEIHRRRKAGPWEAVPDV